MSTIERYARFITACQNQKINGTVEMHHIVPLSLGGKNDKSNLIALTLRQHYIAHWMLWKIYKGPMAQAFFMMNNDTKYNHIGSRAYEKIREDAKVNMRQKRKEYMAKPEAKENLRKHRANQIIPKEAYEKQAKVMSSLVWLNDGTRSYRVRPELVDKKLSEGLKHGRLCNYINKDYKNMRSQIASNQWQALKAKGHTGSLKGTSL